MNEREASKAAIGIVLPWIIAAALAGWLIGGMTTGRAGDAAKVTACPSPTPCPCERTNVIPPDLPTYSPEPGIETWKSLNQKHPATEPIR